MEKFYFESPADSCRSSFALSHSGQTVTNESWQWLNKAYLDQHNQEHGLQAAISNRQIMAINKAHPRWQELQKFRPPGRGMRLNLVACGDVGSTILLGLRLLAGETISSIGIYDINPDNTRRWEFELNQVAGPTLEQEQPELEIIGRGQLFDCDVFVFCATAAVPPLEVKGDVRLLQYQKNAAIIKDYAIAARKANFDGLFAVVSDPVDQLCHAAFMASNHSENGGFDGMGLFAEQIEGYGLGVMYARARYFAKKEPRFASFLDQGRAFGPHGQGLIIANSIDNYDDALSQQLTKLALTANIKAREFGFKPYVAPAISSAVLNLLATLRGQWHYSATFLGGIFMGCRSRRLKVGIETESLILPNSLEKRLEKTASILSSFIK